MERIAQKIIALIDDVRWSSHDIDYLAWQIVSLSPKPMLRRVVYLAEAIIFHNQQMQEEHNDQYTLF